MTNVLVVEDTLAVREFLEFVLSADPEIRVVGTARDGEEALDAVERLRPDVITMDINMPNMNGFEATRRLMETHPTPIVIVSGSWDPKEVATTFRAIEAGALAVLPRPTGIGHPDHEASARELVQTVKLMSEVKVVRRWPHLQRKTALPAGPSTAVTEPGRTPGEVTIVAIGASTGGPVALQAILSRLPKDFPAPMLIVQHMAPGFVQGFVEWLAQSSGFPVQLAAHGERLLPGHAYVAPDGWQTGVESGGRIVLSKDEAENCLRPSVSYCFRAVADVYGKCAIGVLLTGMGKDGAKELKAMQDKGAITVVQDKESSVVHGMPGEAMNLGAAMYVLPPDRIAEILAGSVRKR